MGFMDKAKDLAGKHEDKVDKGLDKGSQMADERTGGKHTEHIEKGEDQVRGRLGVEEQGNDQGGQPGEGR